MDRLIWVLSTVAVCTVVLIIRELISMHNQISDFDRKLFAKDLIIQQKDVLIAQLNRQIGRFEATSAGWADDYLKTHQFKQ